MTTGISLLRIDQFDIVLTSNVLEHVEDLVQMKRKSGACLNHPAMLSTLCRPMPGDFGRLCLLRPRPLHVCGICEPRSCHAGSFSRSEAGRLVRVWSRIARHLAAPLAQRRHGERGNIISELWLFHPNWWRRSFRENGFELISDEPMGLFYTGHMVFAKKWPLEKRARLARTLGSASHLFK